MTVKASPYELAGEFSQFAFDLAARARELMVGVEVAWLKHDIHAEIVDVRLDPEGGIAYKLALRREDGSLEEGPDEWFKINEIGWYTDKTIDLDEDCDFDDLDLNVWTMLFPSEPVL